MLATLARIEEDASCTIMARVEDRPATFLTPGAPLKQADIASLLLTIRNVFTDQTVAGFDEKPLSTSGVWFDALAGWSQDGRGHNFRYTIGPEGFPAAETEYRITVKITLTDGRTGFALFDVTTERTH